MATATQTVSVTFEDAPATTRVKRPWTELYPNAVAYVDGVLTSFTTLAKGEGKDFRKAVAGIDIPLERASENPDMRAIRLLNERARQNKMKVHATMSGGKIVLVNAEKVIRKRNRNKDNGNTASE